MDLSTESLSLLAQRTDALIEQKGLRDANSLAPTWASAVSIALGAKNEALLDDLKAQMLAIVNA